MYTNLKTESDGMSEWMSFSLPKFVKDTCGLDKNNQEERQYLMEDEQLTETNVFGNLIYSTLSDMKKTITDVGTKIKKTVEQNSILGKFNKEQQKFMNSQLRTVASAYPPWLGCPNEEVVREECLNLSNDKRNFIRNLPIGIDFQFDYDVYYPVAIAAMAKDPALVKMRFNLVPKEIKENDFWKNYFYRVNLICQANGANTFSKEQDTEMLSLDERIIDAEHNPVKNLVEVEEFGNKLDFEWDEEWEKELDEECQHYKL